MKLRGFTLIELIVVMGILAILATIVVIAVNPARQFASSRNAKRASDTRAIQIAIDQHAADNNGIVHASITTTPQNMGTSGLDLTSVLVPNYLSAIPFDPSGGSASDTKYVVYKDTNNRVSVVAPSAELTRTIGYGGTPNTAAQFTSASSEFLSLADNASISTGDIDYWLSGWFYLDDVSAEHYIVTKFDSGSNGEYHLRFVTGTNMLIWSPSNGAGTGIGTATATTFGALSANTWYHFFVWHDAVNNLSGIKVNTTANTVATTGVGGDSTSTFKVGTVLTAGASYHNGRIDSLAFGKSPSGGISAIHAAITTSLYNNGSGKHYDDLTEAEKTAWGLVSWWDLNEDSGTRRDAHGTNHLTDNNTVTDAAGR